MRHLYLVLFMIIAFSCSQSSGELKTLNKTEALTIGLDILDALYAVDASQVKTTNSIDSLIKIGESNTVSLHLEKHLKRLDSISENLKKIPPYKTEVNFLQFSLDYIKKGSELSLNTKNNNKTSSHKAFENALSLMKSQLFTGREFTLHRKEFGITVKEIQTEVKKRKQK